MIIFSIYEIIFLLPQNVLNELLKISILIKYSEFKIICFYSILNIKHDFLKQVLPFKNVFSHILFINFTL